MLLKIEDLEFCINQGIPFDHHDTCTIAAENGQIDCLIYAYENGYPLNKTTFEAAVKGGYLNCLRYSSNKFPWDKKECLKIATENNDIQIIEYILEQIEKEEKLKKKKEKISILQKFSLDLPSAA
jgi:hypothetical protein